MACAAWAFPRALTRRKRAPHDARGLDKPSLTDEVLRNASAANRVLIIRPIVVTPLGVKPCRPSEAVLGIPADRPRGGFAKKGGERVADGRGQRVGGG